MSQGEDDGKIDDMESGKETDGIGQIPDTNMNNENPCMDIEQNDTMASDLEEIELFTGKNSPVSVPITCPICLEHYKEGDTVVLSGNPCCTHVFHQHCILDYLVRHDEGTSPCPCCRQVFLPKEVLRGGWKKKASPGRSE